MKKAFYPPLIAAFLVLALFNANSHQIASASVIGLPLLVSVGATGAIWLLLRLVLKGWSRAALPTCILVIMLLEYGHFREALGLDEALTSVVWVATFIMLGLATIVLIKKPPTFVFNILAICLTLVVLVPFGIFAMSTPPIPTRAIDSTLEGTNTPDIYYIVMDEYSRDDVLLDMCGFDNSEFTTYLRDKGFYVADDSYTSYPATTLYLASSLNMNYLPMEANITEVCNLIYNNEVYEQLRRLDYTIVHIHSWWNVTTFFESADVNYNYDDWNEFFRLFCDMTMFRDMFEEIEEEHHYKCIKYQFDKLREIPKISEPTFTFAHIVMAHAPYLFNPDGSPKDREDIPPTGRMYVEPYIDQIRAANRMLKETIDAILAKGDAVIILQSDTGTQPLNLLPYLSEHDGTFSNVMQDDPYIVEARLANLSAIYPDIGHELISPANTFRIVFNHYFDTNYEILPDRQFFTTAIYTPPFELFEVTDSLKEYINK